MRKEGYWVIRTYRSGQVGEKIKYWVPGAKPSSSERRIRSEIKKQQSNEASAEKHAARIINENFTRHDALITLSYSDKGLGKICEGIDASDENQIFHAAHHQLRLWLRRVRRACKDAEIEVKTLAVTADVDGKTGEAVRVHHHIVISEAAVEIAIGKWTLGGHHWEKLYDNVDQTALAAYLLRQVRRLPDEKKYIPSRNLSIPQPQDRIAKGGAEISVPKGGQLLHRSEFSPGQPQYIRYILPDVGRIREEREARRRKRE